MNRRQAKQTAQAIDMVGDALVGALERRQEKQADQMRAAAADRAGETVGFEAAGPPCTTAQRAFLTQQLGIAAKHGVLSELPEITAEITVGQAEGLLAALGIDPEKLYDNGRAWGGGKEMKEWRKGRD